MRSEARHKNSCVMRIWRLRSQTSSPAHFLSTQNHTSYSCAPDALQCKRWRKEIQGQGVGISASFDAEQRVGVQVSPPSSAQHHCGDNLVIWCAHAYEMYSGNLGHQQNNVDLAPLGDTLACSVVHLDAHIFHIICSYQIFGSLRYLFTLLFCSMVCLSGSAALPEVSSMIHPWLSIVLKLTCLD